MKFNDLVRDRINMEQLERVYGGAVINEHELTQACDIKACSNNVVDAKGLCDNAVCGTKAV